MTLLRSIRRIIRGTTRDAERATELPPIPGPAVHVERPSRTECTPENRCETCRGLGTLPWAEGER